MKTFKQNGKYVMPWSAAEFQAAVKKYLRIGGFSARLNKDLFQEFENAILSVNPNRSFDSIYMVFFNIARCDRQVVESGEYSLSGGNNRLLLNVLRAMDPSGVRFIH